MTATYFFIFAVLILPLEVLNKELRITDYDGPLFGLYRLGVEKTFCWRPTHKILIYKGLLG